MEPHYAHRPPVGLRTDVRWGDAQEIAFIGSPLGFDLLQSRQLVQVTDDCAQSWAWAVSVGGFDPTTDTVLGTIIQLDQGAGSVIMPRRILRAPPTMLNLLDAFVEETGVAVGNAQNMRVLVGMAVPVGASRRITITAQIAPINAASGAVPAGLV